MSSKYKEYEDAGMDVVAMNGKGQVQYATNMNMGSEYCDSCRCLIFAPDPDPNDWFRDDDKKAICTAVNATIAGSLEYNELTNIRKPLFCPKLGRELTDDEKKKAEEQLKFARSR